MRARLESKTDETFRQELEKLYWEKNQKIYRAAYGVTGNRQDAKDALQNVFLRLIQRPPSSDLKKNPEGYLCRVGINEARSIGRRQERQKLADVDVNDLDIPLHYDLKCKAKVIAKICRRTRPAIFMSLWRARRELGKLMFTPGGTQ